MTFRAQHLLGIEHLHPVEITTLLDLADKYADENKRGIRHKDVLAGLTQINMFFENSTRTQASFELAGKRLGADVMNMAMQASSIKKGETLIDTAMTLNAMHPDLAGCAPPAFRRGRSAGAKGELRGSECRGRAARTPHAGAAGCADDPPRQGPAAPPVHRDLRRYRP